MTSIYEEFQDELKRAEFKYENEMIKVVALENISKVNIHFNEGGMMTHGPFLKNAEFSIPIWLMKIMQANGKVVVHKEEKPGSFIVDKDKKLKKLTEFFYYKTLDWLDSVEKLSSRGRLSDKTSKKMKSQFVSFLDTRLKKLMNSVSLPFSSFSKVVSEEEKILVKFIKGLFEEWENLVLKRGN